MLTHLSILLVAAVAVVPSRVAAQTDDTTDVVVAALQHMRNKLGPHMVVSGGDRYLTNRPDKLAEILDRAQVKSADHAPKLQCSKDKRPYYAGPEKHVVFREPETAGDSASITIFWSFTRDQTVPRMSVTVQTLNLRKVDGGWTVTGETPERGINTVMESGCSK